MVEIHGVPVTLADSPLRQKPRQVIISPDEMLIVAALMVALTFVITEFSLGLPILTGLL